MPVKIVAIIEARMGSNRLPGKVLKKINNKPIIKILIERLKLSKNIDNIVIATTKKRLDERIINFCKKNSLDYFRGSENDVLDRVTKASIKYKATHILQITGDNPLVDYKVVDYMIDYYFKNKFDYITNNGFGDINKRKIPIGMDVQFFSAEKLKLINNFKLNKIYREHPSLYFYKNRNKKFKIKNVPIPKKWVTNQNIRLTIDTKEDYDLITEIMKKFHYKTYFSLEDIIIIFRKEKYLSKINNEIKQKIINL